MEEKLVTVLNEMAEYLNISQMKKLQEVLLRAFAETELIPANACVYRKNGKCTYRSCISYQFECERPSMCLKQKR